MADSANDVVEIRLSKTVVVLQPNSITTTVHSWAYDSMGNSDGHHIGAEYTGGSGRVYVSLLADTTGSDTFVNITPSVKGVAFVRVFSKERPSVFKTITVYIVDDASTFVVPETIPVTGIELTPNEVVIARGQTIKLNASVVPTNATWKGIRWETSDYYTTRNVIVDSDGNMTARQYGKTTVWARTEDGGYQASCYVTVVESVPSGGGTPSTIQRVELSQSSVSIQSGETASVRVNVVTSDGSVESEGIIWEVRNDGIANAVGSTKNGNVTIVTLAGRSEGSTVVTFHSKADPTKTATLNVNVTPGQDDGGSGGSDTPLDPGQTSESVSVFDGLGEDEEITDITSVGNTLIIATENNMYYFLWRENEYHFLGNQIPVPEIYFRMGNLANLRSVPSATFSASVMPSQSDGFARTEDDGPIFPHENIGDITKYGSSSKKYVFDNDFEKGFWNEFLDVTWGKIDEKLNEQARLGKAVFPIFVRYAVRLYDGTEYAQSIPVLLGADIDRFVDVKGMVAQLFGGTPGDEKNVLTVAAPFVKVAESYSIVMNAAVRNLYDGWEDIVTSVDVFFSSQLLPPQRNAAQFEMELTATELGTMNVSQFIIRDFLVDPYYTKYSQDKLLSYYQTTYLVKSFTLEEYKNLPADYVLDVDTSSDYILAQMALKETPQSMHRTIGENLFNYNKSLLLSGAVQYLSHGYPFLHSVKWGAAGDAPQSVRLVYHLRGENGENTIVCRDENNNLQITPKAKRVVNGSSTTYYECPVAWLAYPDSRCYRIDAYIVTQSGILMGTFLTKVFDQADVAYVFFGFGEPVKAETAVQAVPFEEDIVYNMPNTLVVSKINNPFIFPAEDMVTFTAGKIMNIAVATKALSEGQFGQFPLYVFTDEGVFALSVNAEGRFFSNHPVSRDVLLGRESLVGIEQGVFFAASRGLLLLQGSQVTKVSSVMDGNPEPVEGARVAEPYMKGISIEDPGRFVDFIKDCSIAYDYANTRIVLFNKKEGAQYVYKFDTQSWHRMNAGLGVFKRTLNSYPEAVFVVENANKTQAAYNLSVTDQTEGAVALPGLVYSREIALDSADVYKTIHRLKVRGRFLNKHVVWQLQGSNDGINYVNIHSLHGPSWKWYRLVLAFNLDPKERVSYVEMDYSPRFTNKIR